MIFHIVCFFNFYCKLDPSQVFFAHGCTEKMQMIYQLVLTNVEPSSGMHVIVGSVEAVC